ncbi:ChaN family lipoprotein [Rhodobacteraceae bacterium]|nr:ChaN family lipoprotein [Paracoccaceae bacterium]
MAQAFRGARVVMLGEVHDNPAHHALQARIVADLNPSALVFEMIEPAQARSISPDMRSDANALGDALEWEARGWPDFDMYHTIFTAAPDADIFGGALPRETVRAAVSDGAAQVFGAASSLFGLDDPLDTDEQSTREALQQTAHCNALPENLLPGMVDAQRLRDAALAQAVVNALQQGTPGPIVVIAGNGHVREDWGIANALRHYLEITGETAKIATLGQFEGAAPEAPSLTHWVVTEAIQRDEDPCDAFR